MLQGIVQQFNTKTEKTLEITDFVNFGFKYLYQQIFPRHTVYSSNKHFPFSIRIGKYFVMKILISHLSSVDPPASVSIHSIVETVVARPPPPLHLKSRKLCNLMMRNTQLFSTGWVKNGYFFLDDRSFRLRSMKFAT